MGDWAQLSSVEAGGAFGLLVVDRGDLAPELVDVRRFRSGWEKPGSVELRLGHQGAIGSYCGHRRVAGGDRTVVLERLYRARKADIGVAAAWMASAHPKRASVSLPTSLRSLLMAPVEGAKL